LAVEVSFWPPDTLEVIAEDHTITPVTAWVKHELSDSQTFELSWSWGKTLLPLYDLSSPVCEKQDATWGGYLARFPEVSIGNEEYRGPYCYVMELSLPAAQFFDVPPGTYVATAYKLRKTTFWEDANGFWDDPIIISSLEKPVGWMLAQDARRGYCSQARDISECLDELGWQVSPGIDLAWSVISW
jgi:hypothetical protein